MLTLEVTPYTVLQLPGQKSVYYARVSVLALRVVWVTQAVHQDILRETSFLLFCANCLELVA